MDPLKHIAEFQLDVLKEVGNIGAGHAATALSKLLNKPVDMKIPLVSIVPFEQVTDSLGGDEEIVIAIFLRVVGDAPGNMFFILSHHSAAKLLNHMAGIQMGGEEGLSEMEVSALLEIGNILVGSYLSSLADLTQLSLSPTVPSIAIDMAGAIMSFGVLQFGAMGDRALLIDTQFLEDNEEMEGHFFFIPDPESFEKIFHALGVPFE